MSLSRGPFKKGDIVRYFSGPSALARLSSPHAGGWHAEQVYGGFLFVSNCWTQGDEQEVWDRIQLKYPKSAMSIKERTNKALAEQGY